jgi:flagellar biosynthesis protein
MAERKDVIGAKHTRWSRPDPAQAGSRTPIAIALDAKGRDGGSRPKTPRVAATGRGPVAEQILAIAFEKGVPVREDADLAQILSYVYRANRTWTGEENTEPAEPFGAEP